MIIISSSIISIINKNKILLWLLLLLVVVEIAEVVFLFLLNMYSVPCEYKNELYWAKKNMGHMRTNTNKDTNNCNRCKVSDPHSLYW